MCESYFRNLIDLLRISITYNSILHKFYRSMFDDLTNGTERRARRHLLEGQHASEKHVNESQELN